MDIEFFENLSVEDAERYLQRFLEVERSGIKRTVRVVRSAGVEVDYSLESVAPFIVWTAESVRTREVPKPTDLPGWLATSIPAEDLVEVAEASRSLVLRAAYYLGESLVRNRPNLRWGVGSADFAHQQQPSVLGFRGDQELPVLLVTENTVLNATQADDPRAAVERPINTWIDRA
jgi:hypothetical protein